MDEPQFERWVGNSRECDDAVEAATGNQKQEAIDALLEAERYAHNSDYPERHECFLEAKNYVEFKFGKTYRELQLELFEEVLSEGLDDVNSD